MIYTNKRQATGSIQLISSLLNCIKIKALNYASTFTSFNPKIFRLADLGTICKWKYDITVIWIQFLIRRISLLDILSLKLKVLKIFVFLLFMQVLRWQQPPIFSLDNSENYVFIDLKWSFFEVLPFDIES